MNTKSVTAYLEMIRTYDYGVEVPLHKSFSWFCNLIFDYFPEFASTLKQRLLDPQFEQILKLCFDGRPALKDSFESGMDAGKCRQIIGWPGPPLCSADSTNSFSVVNFGNPGEARKSSYCAPIP